MAMTFGSFFKRFVDWYSSKARNYGRDCACSWDGENVKDIFKNVRK